VVIERTFLTLPELLGGGQITLLKQALKEKVYIGEKGGSGTSKERK
jgi:hypothetical protein